MENASTATLTLRDFQPGDEDAFRRINVEWISHYFKVEPEDESSFDDPQKKILDPGGRIFFACMDGEPVGCCALRVMEPGEYEVAKMGVTPAAQGHGVGRRMLEHVVAEARKMGATRLYLETNHALTPAIRLYEKIGFRNVPSERLVVSPYVRADVFMELWVTRAG
jgi:GNAT superfamily N-acetyltransferase